jgi:predicted aldo/keto reductase-like oxidoreductase
MSIDLVKMPKLGFGMMRLPEKDGEIVIDEVCRMVDMYMDAGLNYFDTAYPYHSGKSEVAVGEALVKRHPRDSYMLASKLPGWELKEEGDCDRIFETQLERTGAGFFDFYLIHSVEDGNIDTYEKYDAFNWGLKKKAEGKVRHIGFSFHGSPKLLVQVLDKYPEMEFVQIQLNYADWENPVVRSGELYEILKERNIPMIIMEPVKGGSLASLKPEMEEKFRKLRPDASIASWALRFVGSLPGVMTILSGMSDESQMLDNINTFLHFEPLSDEEESAVEEVRQMIMEAPIIGCTACRYCVDGCPMSISIPDVFRSVNTLRLYDDDGFRPKAFYRGLLDKHGKASDCIACGQCEEACPQHLPIIELMREASKLLDE